LELSTPPDGLTGSLPPMAVLPASVIRHPWPGAAVDDVAVFGIPHDE
jgi:hypothetical protein